MQVCHPQLQHNYKQKMAKARAEVETSRFSSQYSRINVYKQATLLFLLYFPGYVSEAAKLGSEGLPACRSFTLEELKEATNNFDMSAIMGEGSYGKVMSSLTSNGNS